MPQRYTLNVTKDVYADLMEKRHDELRKTGKSPTVDEILRRLLKIKPASSKKETT